MKKNNKINKTTLSHNKKEILTIKSNVWIKMINLDSNTSEIINFANLKYNKNEILKSKLNESCILAGGKGSRISEYTKKIQNQ